MQILQITDPHLYGGANGRLRGVETDSSLHAVLDDAFARVPDYSAILVTGDLVQDDASGYLRFRSIFSSLRKPVLCIPGNHDEPQAMRKELTGAPFQICGTHEVDDWQFIMLDSYDPGASPRTNSRGSTPPCADRPSTPWSVCIITRSS
jgi:Icc protein